MFRLDRVELRYGASMVLRGISAEIPTAGVVVVMWPSGAGKSTLMRVLCFLEVPTSGFLQLSLGGRTYDSRETARPWPNLTCVFQKQFLWPHLTLLQNLHLPLMKLERSEAQNRVASVIELFGMGEFVGRFPNEVSGGQAQRAALARAFVLHPKLVIIDEAHTGLDLEQQATINDHLQALASSGVGIIVVTHSLAFAQQHADHIVVLEGGLVAELGPRSILNSPSSKYLVRAVQRAGHYQPFQA